MYTVNQRETIIFTITLTKYADRL